MSRRADRTLDELLVLACADGSESAFVALHRRFHEKLLAHAGHLLGRQLADRADDVCQDAWVSIQHGIAALKEPRHFRSWAYSIVTRRVADVRRRLGREQRASDELQQQYVNRSSSTDDSEERDELRSALDSLSSEDRALLRLFYLDELSVAETAAALAIPPGTVKSRLFHARQRLRRAMKKQDPGEE